VKKAQIKVELLPKYSAWADGVLAAGGAQQDDVLMFVMLWRIDAGDYAGGWRLPRMRCAWLGDAAGAGPQRADRCWQKGWQTGGGRAALKAEFPADVLLQTLD
jgi:hypothetical protein